MSIALFANDSLRWMFEAGNAIAVTLGLLLWENYIYGSYLDDFKRNRGLSSSIVEQSLKTYQRHFPDDLLIE